MTLSKKQARRVKHLALLMVSANARLAFAEAQDAPAVRVFRLARKAYTHRTTFMDYLESLTGDAANE